MRTVTIRMHTIDLSREMVAMRGWLDRNGHEPARFDCDTRGGEVVLSVDFRSGAAAEAFAQRFDGEGGPRASMLGQWQPSGGIDLDGPAHCFHKENKQMLVQDRPLG
jgi:hypothetical protein